MKSVKKVIISAFLFVFSAFFLTAQTTGFDLSNSVYDTFYSPKLRIRTQNLVNSSENQFPFNVYVTFQSQDRSRSFSSKQFIIVIDQEQALKHTDFVRTLLNSLQNQTNEYTTIILFSYGDYQNVEKQGMIYGTSVYLNTANVNENTTGLILDLEAQKNAIITSSNGISSPSFLVKTAMNLFSKNEIPVTLPAYYISQQYKFNFFLDQQLDFFFKQEIPAIKLSFTSNTPEQNIFSLCTDFIEQYNSRKDFIWDQHFIIVRIFKSYHRLVERNIVRLIITLFFMCILFIFLLGFVNSNIKNKTWKKIKQIWFAAPIIFILILIAFFIGKIEFLLFGKNFSYTGKIAFLFVTQIFWSMILCSTYFVLQIKKGMELLNEKAIDFLIFFTSSFNLFVFSFMDISLFPLLLLDVMISILLLILNKKYLHIILCFLMVIPYAPYIHNIFQSAEISLFQQFYTDQNLIYIPEALLITPIILTYFRILTSFREKLSTYKRLVITNTIGLVITVGIFSGIGIASTLYRNKTYTKKEVLVPQVTSEDKIICKWTDRQIFTDKVRTLNIRLPEDTVQCKVLLDSVNVAPVQYSNSDFEMLTPTQASFLIPYYPGSRLTFTYGYENLYSLVTIETIYYDSDTGNLYSSIKHISTGGYNE